MRVDTSGKPLEVVQGMHVLLNFLQKSLLVAWKSLRAKLKLLLQKSVFVRQNVENVNALHEDVGS